MPRQSHIPRFEPEDDLKCLIENERQLEMCGYYYGSLSRLDASDLLKECQVGTFLVRDSSHSSYLYTLSVQTEKGTISYRINYSKGFFRLDSSNYLCRTIARFQCVNYLIDFYFQLPKWESDKAEWLDKGDEAKSIILVQMCQPLYRQVRSLSHMCRVNIVTQVRMGPWIPWEINNPAIALKENMENDSRCKNLPKKIIDYLSWYPYSQ